MAVQWRWLLIVLALFTPSHAQTKEDGFKSAVFDPKYIPFQELLITPKTHPGRWHRRRERYSASTWPGSYLTSLIYGRTCIVKLRPQHVGMIPSYTFYVSVDGGEDLLYTLPGFDSLDPDREIIYVPLTIPSSPNSLNETAVEEVSDVLQPHTVRITSVSDTPFCFEGYLVENTLVKQGNDWTEKQDDRLVVEFVGEGIDAETFGGLLGYDEGPKTSTGGMGEGYDVTVLRVQKDERALILSVQYRVAEAMGIRHIHISTGTCLFANCNSRNPYPGLMSQYFHENPVSPALGSEVIRKGGKQWQQSLQQEWQFFAARPWVKTTTPDAVVVDLGVRDILLSDRIGQEAYGRELMVFLGRIRSQARPDAKIVVIARNYKKTIEKYDDGFKSVVPSTPEMLIKRLALFQVTKEAVAALQEEDENIIFLPLTASKSPHADLAHGLCSAIVSSPSTDGISAYTFRNPDGSIPLTRPQKYCASISSLTHIATPPHTTHPHTTYSSRFFTLYALSLTVFASLLVFLLVKPCMVCLGSLGWVRVEGTRRVFGVRDVEGGLGFGGKGRWGGEKKV